MRMRSPGAWESRCSAARITSSISDEWLLAISQMDSAVAWTESRCDAAYTFGAAAQHLHVNAGGEQLHRMAFETAASLALGSRRWAITYVSSRVRDGQAEYPCGPAECGRRRARAARSASLSCVKSCSTLPEVVRIATWSLGSRLAISFSADLEAEDIRVRVIEEPCDVPVRALPYALFDARECGPSGTAEMPRPVSSANALTACGMPLSNTRKSSLFRPRTGCPLGLRTTTRVSTRSDCTEKIELGGSMRRCGFAPPLDGLSLGRELAR